MKENILQKFWIYEKWPVGHLKWLFHKYSALLEQVFELQELGQQDLFYVDENGVVYQHGYEISGIQKIMALIAIWKQKKTPQNTFSHEKKLNLHQVIRKDIETVAIFNNRFEQHGYKMIQPSHQWWNHLLPLSYALQSLWQLTVDEREIKVILAGIIMTYLHLQDLPLWLLYDEVSSDWDDIILEMMDDFDPEKFIYQAHSMGYWPLVDEVIDNCIFSTTKELINKISHIAWQTLYPPNVGTAYNVSNWLIERVRTESRFTNLFLEKMGVIIQSPPSASSRLQGRLSP
jgi:hypothetical protein